MASQVYTYQIQQVLLIHRDTGVLLNSVSLFDDGNENSDLVSAMLTNLRQNCCRSVYSHTLLKTVADAIYPPK
ncbi:MAG: hypothetical protein ACJAVV_000176 [Alphaproteobacteria bacterium]